jgi:dipeptidyl-peptidase 4
MLLAIQAKFASIQSNILMKVSQATVLRLALVWIAAFPLHAKQPVTLQDLFARSSRAATPPSAVWRPDGKAYAYQEEKKVFLYDIGVRRSKEWFNLEDVDKKEQPPSPAADREPFNWKNRRVNSSGLQWFPDGRSILAPAHTGLFVFDAGNSKPRQTIAGLNEENVPTLSPDGRAIVFRKNANLYVEDLASRRAVQLTSDGTDTRLNGQLDWVYPEELDLGKAFWWSPDSRRIAYMQFEVSKEFVYPHADLIPVRAVFEPQRYPQAGTPNANVRVGVVSASGGSTTWMDLGGASQSLIARVNWLPDSKTVAIQRLTRVQDALDLVFADATSGIVRNILSERDKTWINTSDDLHFFPGKDSFLWSSERSGFRHLYLYSTQGQLFRQLTSGNWQVNKVVAVNDQTGSIYYTSSQDSPLENQLYRVSIAGGAPQRLSTGSGTHSIQIDEHATNYLDTFSNLTTPPETTLRQASGEPIAVICPIDKAIPAKYDILPTEIVKTAASDGTLLYARLIKPSHFESGKKYPVIVFVYGGPQAQSVHNAWGGLSWEQVLAHQGFVIWQLDNRGSYGRGHQFESPVYRELGHIELADQKIGVDKLISLGFVDKTRIGIYGWSFGGYMTLYSLLHAPDVFKVGIAGAPVTDWHNYDTIYTERYMGIPDQNAEGYKNSSNVLAASNLEGKLLIVCNYEDDNVLFQNTMQMITALRRADKQFEFALYPQKTHGVTGDLRRGMMRQMTDFFETNLKPESR